MSVSEKVVGLESLPAWRHQVGGVGPIAIVTGTFDLFHPGNLYAIRHAREVAPVVMILVEPDDVAARHCRPGRPQNRLETRVEMVAHLRDVAGVASATPDQMREVLMFLKPCLWVTANSQKAQDLYGPAFESSAIHRETIKPLEGCSSEEILRAIEHHRTPVVLPVEWEKPSPRPVSGGKREGVVVTVNGCFDILHVGHLRFLEEAREMGDSLTVLINSDASVARYKGPTRPVFPESFRAAALKALASVDDVVVFPGDKPLDEIRKLRPRIHVKGGSYEPDRVRQERELVESWGGHLVCTPMVEGFSTTATIKKVLQGLREDVIESTP